MSKVEALPARSGIAMHPAVLIGLLFAAAAALTWRHLSGFLPANAWLPVLWRPEINDPQQMLVHYTVFPRIAVALLAGAALGLAGTVCQQVLRNPLAEPSTLGVLNGAYLALSVTTLWAPSLLTFGREWIALLGGFAAFLCVFGLTWRRALSPVVLVLAGLIVAYYCAVTTQALILLNHEYLIGLFIWGAGFLNQQDWNNVAFLAPRFIISFLLIAAMVRPLTLLGFDDETARNLGLGLTGARVCALGIAIALSASVVSVVGVMGFVGLSAPAIVMLSGARRFRDRLIWAPLCGALLLWLTDELVLLIPPGYREMPAGAATALIGAPMLLLLLPRLRATAPVGNLTPSVPPRLDHPWRVILFGLALLLLVVWIALAVGVGSEGWSWSGLAGIQEFLPWRWPRVVSALAAGATLAVAGTLLQRMTGNPMAAPEVMGISYGAAMGVLVLLYALPSHTRAAQIAAGAIGAFSVLGLVLLFSRRSEFSPERVLLAGVAMSAAFGAIMAMVLATGDPRIGMLLSLLAGSLYQIGPTEAAILAIAAIILLALVPMLSRWLDILPLGQAASRSVGVSMARSRIIIMLLTALLTATATLMVGLLSLVGFIAPHMARMMGAQRALHQVALAALIGATLMVFADWAGRMVIFPFQMPAGIFAMMLAGPYLVWLLRPRRA
ncbi:MULTISPECIES: Fe(3+)-hydroxamate ABC transporter permease FhuB [unclassified Bradyrhizobium]|uniref:Fe(3+)-hydroxamate ABC transporter permease FhuB n=1 Tax=unclassified Bradyrhizobium TaxID=2631580 RepID=UPI001BA509D1|nr:MULTISPECIES: Fe(3+)-hydroxamate ABC transporter permease FhuB [unclassified Bradyrhizobium]MBR1228054.1 Fe(3+)-hydroxamate ABC transporter permease FhuB [Bradyrhizobium sp. AUGA SZCCT0176]MBR1296063.1 Fe(3+)-hydroxamate ABC transporter permease FhuB [Bradyrhizobium sp. AUGA SZCCT0042]